MENRETKIDIAAEAAKNHAELFIDFCNADIDLIFREFCKANGVSDVCPYCGGKAWSLSKLPGGASGVTGLKLHAGLLDNRSAENFLPSLALTCDKCGNVRIHALGVVHDWWAERERVRSVGS